MCPPFGPFPSFPLNSFWTYARLDSSALSPCPGRRRKEHRSTEQNKKIQVESWWPANTRLWPNIFIPFGKKISDMPLYAPADLLVLFLRRVGVSGRALITPSFRRNRTTYSCGCALLLPREKKSAGSARAKRRRLNGSE